MKSNCVFCNIISTKNEEYQNQVFYDKGGFVAMLTKNPATYGHFLVIPKKHFTSIFEMKREELNKSIEISARIAKKIIPKLGAKAFVLKLNNKIYTIEKGAGHVSHIHLHIIPRYKRGEKIDSFPKPKTLKYLAGIKKKIFG